MLGRLCWTVTLLLVALTMGLEFAHLLEWQPKAEYPGALYVRLQESLYVWFGTVGAVLYVAAILATVALAVVRRRDRPPLVPLAALAEIVALVTFLVFIFPVNQRFPIHSAGTVPPDWTALRDRWEITHAGGFVLFAAAFLLLLSAARPGARVGGVRTRRARPQRTRRPRSRRRRHIPWPWMTSQSSIGGVATTTV